MSQFKHCLAHWPLRYGPNLTIDQIVAIAKSLHCSGVELCPDNELEALKDAELECPLYLPGFEDGTAPFAIGLAQPEQWGRVVPRVLSAIDFAAKSGIPKVLVFTGCGGEREGWQTRCLQGLEKVAAHAEANGVVLVLEHLNDVDLSHPMKGHEGYLGNRIAEVAAVVRDAKSPNVKLLFDAYHVQLTEGAVVPHIGDFGDLIGHFHVAGVRGRGSLAAPGQQIDYPEVMKALKQTGYRGYVGQEFIFPDGATAAVIRKQLQESLELCAA